MKFDSIKSRLILITAVCVFGMLLMMFNQLHYTSQLLELHEQKDVVREMNNDLLQLRRHEKDFLLRMDIDYAGRFDTTYNQLLSKLEQVDALVDDGQQNQSQFEAVKLRLNEYATLFSQVVGLQQKIGLNDQSGMLASLEDAYLAIQQRLSRSDSMALQLSMAEVKLSEKNILLRMDADSVEQQAQAYAVLVGLTAQLNPTARNDVLSLLEAYQNSVVSLVLALQQIGFSHQTGLHGELRRKAHEVEDQFAMYIANLLPQIAEEEQEVKRNSLLIMAATAITLVLLMVKSFATFHKAFANFVMFFYRCKREYQRLDERKLGFSEFKSLAVLANEMVDAKKETELQLKEAEKQLHELNKEHPNS